MVGEEPDHLFVPPAFRMMHHREAVGPLAVDELRPELQERRHHVHPAQHRRTENVDPSAAVEQVEGDLPLSDVGRGSQGRLEISAAPIVAGVGEGRLGFYQLSDAVQIRVGETDGFANPFQVEPGRAGLVLRRGDGGEAQAETCGPRQTQM